MNFSAGPAVLPKTVLARVQKELLDFGSTGSSLMELSHRSKPYEQVHNKAQQDLRSLLSIPDDYDVLFMQGGATGQFSAVVYNFCDFKRPVDYLETGAWSAKAKEEASRLGANVNVVYSTKASKYTASPDPKEFKFSKDPCFIYYCDNETVHGVELPVDIVDHFPKNVPIICDMSSNLCSRPFDVSKYTCIIAGAQKNLGPAGVTIVILKRNSLVLRESPVTPIMFDYKTFVDSNSLYNTPPTFPIYVCGLVFDELCNKGGIPTELNRQKSALVYETIEKYDTFSCPVDPHVRSRMNIPFRVCRNGQPNEEAEKEFLKQAEARGLLQLKGHRSVGGIRASLYNAIPYEWVQALVAFMTEFAQSSK